jgi:hypothetical protein
MWKIKGFQRPYFPLPPSLLHSPQNVFHSILIPCNKFGQEEIKIGARKMFTYHCSLEDILFIFCCTCICNNLAHFSCLYILLQTTRLGFLIFCHFCFHKHNPYFTAFSSWEMVTDFTNFTSQILSWNITTSNSRKSVFSNFY